LTAPAPVKIEADSGARERLMAAALSLFNEKGYAATSVREVVAAAGVTKPVLYYYFGNKEGLFLELMQSANTTFESLVQKISLEDSAQQSIISFCSELLTVVETQLDLVRLLYAMYYGPPQGAPAFDLEANYYLMLGLMERLVSAGIERGELAPENVEDVARAIVAIFTSCINDLLCPRETKMGCAGMVRMLQLLMKGITKE
jgi:TetR/AcrR family transcriptional regulator